ncbi:hypothetical protein GGX14DRAFT_365415, partial [Mycena pura]
VLMEANVLQWACTFLTYTYSFIDNFMQSAGKKCPFDIPNLLRFVHAGLAKVMGSRESRRGNRTGIAHA